MILSPVRFRDRRDAGRRLAAALARYRDLRPIILALPRGGVPVGFEVARALAAPLDVLLVRKIGAPGYPELGLGAVVDGADPHVVLTDSVMREVMPASGYVEAETERQLAEIERRRRLYRGGRPAPSIVGHVVILVDDGIATGGTVTAALQGLAAARPARLVLAVPVAPPEVLETLSRLADDVVCLSAPHVFGAVGRFYDDFDQTTDEEVIRLLAEAAARPA
ncbi:phosphoribosyltransferase [Inquilinus sp. NPDC058860]|uniref:phosphoribosyltransferase n=1 Tax=Inquilinus sp. NPDC058860 TaxID=3346652 RepID=UPI0036CDFEA1